MELNWKWNGMEMIWKWKFHLPHTNWNCGREKKKLWEEVWAQQKAQKKDAPGAHTFQVGTFK